MDQARINNLLFSDETMDASPRVGGSPIVASIPAQPEAPTPPAPAPVPHHMGMNIASPMNTPSNPQPSIPQLPPPTHLLQGHGGYQPAGNPTISIPAPQFSAQSTSYSAPESIPQTVPQPVPQSVPQQAQSQHNLQQSSQTPPPQRQASTPAPAPPASSSSDPARSGSSSGSGSAPQGGQRTGNSLLIDAVAKKKITQDEAILLQKTLAEAKRRAALDPSVRPKDFVTATLRSRLGDDRARAVISAVAVQTPRPGGHPAPRPPSTSAAPAPSAGPGLPPSGSGPSNGRAKSPPPTAAKEKPQKTAGSEKVKPNGEPAAKAPRKRGPKTGDEAGGGRKRGPKAAAAAAAANEAKQAAEATPKENFGLDPVSIDEYQMSGRPGGQGKRSDAASSLLESVVPSDLAVTEEKQARAERRDTAGGSGLRNGSGLLRGALYSSANNHSASSWDSDAVMTRAKILSISEQILGMADPSISIDEDAVKYIAFAAQNILSDLVEGSIISSRRRRNQTAVQQFDKIQQLMQLPGHEKGVAIPEHGHNLGMAWYEDIEKRTLTDGLEFVQSYDSKFAELKEQVKNDLMKYDEERKLTGKKRQLAGTSGAVEQEDPWWVKDDEAEKAGLLSWSELAMAQLRLSVAKEFNLGPSRQRRAASKNKGEEATAAEAGSSMEISTDQASTGEKNNAETSTTTQSDEWTSMRCPLFSEEGDVVTVADVLRNLSKRSKTRCAGGYFSEQVGNAVYRAKLGLPAVHGQE